MKKIAYDCIALDQGQIVEDSKCCLKVNAIISRAGVYQYDDGKALKSKQELLKATRTARYAKLTIGDHPTSQIIQSQRDIKGGVEKPFFDSGKLRAILNFDKYELPKETIDQIRDAITKKTGLDNSIGFYYTPDWTAGLDKDVNTGKEEHYDYVMRDIVIDHVAVITKPNVYGRCHFPQCGVGADSVTVARSMGKTFPICEENVKAFEIDKVVKRGEKWCVVHCHGEEEGEVIKCFATKEEAEAMHRAIQAKKHDGSVLGDQDNRPPQDWWDNCTSKAQSFADDPDKFCGWLWNHGDESIKSSFGSSSVSNIGGKQNMSEQETRYPERSEEFNKCVKERMAEGMTQGEAEAHCQAATLPSDEPTPPTGAAKITQAQEEQVEKTPLERCIAEQMDAGKTEEEATEWCKAELAGEHEEVDSLIQRSEMLLEMKAQRDIERQRESRRHPI